MKLTDVGLHLAWENADSISIRVPFTLVADSSIYDAPSKRLVTVDVYGSDAGEPGGGYRQSPIWRFLFGPPAAGAFVLPVLQQFSEVTVAAPGPNTFEVRNIIPGAFLDEDPDPRPSYPEADEVYVRLTVWAGASVLFATPVESLASPTITVPVFGARGT